MPRSKHIINIHTSTGTTAPVNANLILGEIAVQHTPNDPAMWIKVGTSESSDVYEKFIGETEILTLINDSKILGSGYTYSGLPQVNSSTTIADAFSALTKEVNDNEYVVATALNDLNGRIEELSGSTGPETDPVFAASVAASITQEDITKWNNAAGGGGSDPDAITGITMNGGAVSISNRVAALGTVITEETQLSKGTATGTGNVVTDIDVSNHQITLVKSYSAAPANQFVTLSGATHKKITSLSAATTSHTADTDIHVTATEKSTWNDKQDTITDLAEIRTNAASGMTAYNDVNALSAGTLGELNKKSNTGHTHTISEVSDLETALDGKSNTGHTHEISDVEELQTALDGKSNTGHTHSNYATTGTVSNLRNTVTAHTANTEIHVTTAQTAAWDGKQDAIADLDTIRNNAEAGASKVSNVQADWDATSGLAVILNKPTIPVVPTSNTAFTNDAGYITGYTETDPTVPGWAKAASKPTYTASEVGALPTGTTLDNVPDGTTRKLSDYSLTGHTHEISEVTGLQTALDGKSNTGHTHVVGNVTGLQAALDGKSNTGHTHEIADVNGLQTALDGKSGTGHTHSNYATTGDVNTLSSATQSIQSSAQTAYNSRITGGTITSGATNNITTTNNRVAITAATLPSYSTANNDQVLMIKDGVPTWVTPSTITYSPSQPTGGNDGDIWVQTS